MSSDLWVALGLIVTGLIAVIALTRTEQSRSKSFCQFLSELDESPDCEVFEFKSTSAPYHLLTPFNMSSFSAYRLSKMHNSARVYNKSLDADYIIVDAGHISAWGKEGYILQSTLFLFNVALDKPSHVLCVQTPSDLKGPKMLKDRQLKLHRLYPNGRSLEAWLPDELKLADVENSEFGRLFTHPKAKCFYSEVHKSACLFAMSMTSLTGRRRFYVGDMKVEHLHKLHTHAIDLFSALNSK